MRQRHHPTPNKSTRYSDLWLIIVLAAVLFAFMYGGYRIYQAHQLATTHQHPRPLLTTANPSDHKTASRNSKPNHDIKFDFYSMLSKSKIARSTPNTAPISDQSFRLQAAAVQNQTAAVLLKQKLEDLGYPAAIQVNPTQPGWYKVVIGPYGSANAARKDKNRLLNQNVTTFLLNPTT